MSRIYFPSSETDEIEQFFLEEPTEENPKGVYVKIKTRLTWGERKRLDSAAVTSMSTEQRQAAANGEAVDGADQDARTMTYGLNLFLPNFLKAAAHTVEWNLPGTDKRVVRLPRNIDEKARLMERLDEEIGDEIAAFIDRVVAEKQKALQDAKDRAADGDMLNGKVSASSSRVIDGRATDDEGNPTPPPVGLVPSGGWRQD